MITIKKTYNFITVHLFDISISMFKLMSVFHFLSFFIHILFSFLYSFGFVTFAQSCTKRERKKKSNKTHFKLRTPKLPDIN